jgi:hypothetical protein
MQAILIATMLAAPGDAVYVFDGDAVVLNTAQKQALKDAVAEGFPDVKPVDMDRYYCFASPQLQVTNRMDFDVGALKFSNDWRCIAVDGKAVVSDGSDFEMDMGVSSLPCRARYAGGKTLLVCESAKMSQAGRVLNEAFVRATFGATLDLDDIWDFLCERNPELASEITCKPNYLKIASMAQRKVDKIAKKVKRTLGKVGS